MNNQVVVIKKDKKVKVKKDKPVPVIVEEVIEEVVEEEVVEGGVVEEQVDDEVDEELAEQERIIKEATEKAEFLRMKKQLKSRSGEFLEKLKVSMKDELEKINIQKQKLEEEIELLESINEEEDDVMGLLSEHYADFVNELAFPKSQTKTKKNTEKKGTRTAIDRKAYPNFLIDRMVFQASGNHKTDKERGKITMEVVFNADTKKFYNKTTKKEYDLLQDANREWCNKRGYDKLGNAWEDFKALNLKTNMTRSIHNLHQDNWIADSVSEAANYIDNNFKF